MTTSSAGGALWEVDARQRGRDSDDERAPDVIRQTRLEHETQEHVRVSRRRHMPDTTCETADEGSILNPQITEGSSRKSAPETPFDDFDTDACNHADPIIVTNLDSDCTGTEVNMHGGPSSSSRPILSGLQLIWRICFWEQNILARATLH